MDNDTRSIVRTMLIYSWSVYSLGALVGHGVTDSLLDVLGVIIVCGITLTTCYYVGVWLGERDND